MEPLNVENDIFNQKIAEIKNREAQTPRARLLLLGERYVGLGRDDLFLPLCHEYGECFRLLLSDMQSLFPINIMGANDYASLAYYYMSHIDSSAFPVSECPFNHAFIGQQKYLARIRNADYSSTFNTQSKYKMSGGHGTTPFFTNQTDKKQFCEIAGKCLQSGKYHELCDLQTEYAVNWINAMMNKK